MKKKSCIFALILLVCIVGFFTIRACAKKRRLRDRDIDNMTRTQVVFIPKKTVPMSYEEECHSCGNFFSEPYFFLGKGKQLQAFIRQDKKYVLKVLKNPERISRVGSCIESLIIAQELIPEYSQVLYVHQETSVPGEITVLNDKAMLQKFPIASTVFFIQPKATKVRKEFAYLLFHKRVDEAKKRLKQIFSLIQTLVEKKIVDRDFALIRNDNIGFLEDRAILIDIGRLRLLPNVDTEQHIEREIRRLKPLKKWFEKYYPHMQETFIECVNELKSNFRKI